MIDLSICIECGGQSKDLLASSLPFVAVVISLGALWLSWQANRTSQSHHRAGVKQAYFATHRDSIAAGQRSLTSLIDDLQRSSEDTVLIDTLHENFADAFSKVQTALSDFEGLMKEVDEAGQFGNDWASPVSQSKALVDAAYDQVLNDQRPENARRHAASEVVSGMKAMVEHSKAKVRTQIEVQAAASVAA